MAISKVVTKDILLRHNIKFTKVLREVYNYIISNFSCQITFNKIKNIFNLKSTHTAQDYIQFLEESYLIFLIERFSFKQKEKVISPRKVYVIDTGLINAVSVGNSKNIGRLYENAVAIELMRKKSKNSNLEIYYWQDTSGKEVDFVLKENMRITQMIQVCYDVKNYDTKTREINSFISAAKAMKIEGCKRIVITSDYERKETINKKTIEFIPLWKWLLLR